MKWGNWAKSKPHRVIIDVALRKPFFLYGCNIWYGTADSPTQVAKPAVDSQLIALGFKTYGLTTLR